MFGGKDGTGFQAPASDGVGGLVQFFCFPCLGVLTCERKGLLFGAPV